MPILARPGLRLTADNPDFKCLDNPVWSALKAGQNHLSSGGEWAKVYLSDVSNFAGTKDNSESSEVELLKLLKPKQSIYLFGIAPEFNPRNWNLLSITTECQMVFLRNQALKVELQVEKLFKNDKLEMLRLAATSAPDAFKEDSQKAGFYYGIRKDNFLVSMGGTRMLSGPYQELSSICTHPDWRRNGYSQAVTSCLINEILESGFVPFLHVHPETSAQRMYEKLGFTERRKITRWKVQKK